MNKQEIIDILSDNSKNDWLFKEADRVRRENVGDEIHLRALVEFSNICKRQCFYCGLRSPNKEVERYRLSKEEILFSAKKAVDLGYKTIVLQSGEDDNYYSDKLCDIIRSIKELDVALTLSIGEKTYEELSVLNFGENFETPNGEYPYRNLRGEDIPKNLKVVLLEEVLDYLQANGDFTYIIEIKDKGENGFKAADELYRILKEKNLLDKVVFGTFNGDVTKYVDENYPDMLRSSSIVEVVLFYLAASYNIDFNDSFYKFDALQIPTNQYGVLMLGSERVVNYAHRHNIAVQYWTINEEDEIKRLNEIGADCIMSDVPDLAYDVINK